MAKPSSVTLTSKQQKAVMKEAKKTTNARKIADSLKLPRHQVMYFLETQGVASYSEGSYC